MWFNCFSLYKKQWKDDKISCAKTQGLIVTWQFASTVFFQKFLLSWVLALAEASLSLVNDSLKSHYITFTYYSACNYTLYFLKNAWCPSKYSRFRSKIFAFLGSTDAQ